MYVFMKCMYVCMYVCMCRWLRSGSVLPQGGAISGRGYQVPGLQHEEESRGGTFSATLHTYNTFIHTYIHTY